MIRAEYPGWPTLRTSRAEAAGLAGMGRRALRDAVRYETGGRDDGDVVPSGRWLRRGRRRRHHRRYRKTPVDHIVSLVTGKDCSIVRQHRGLTYCVEDEVTPPVQVHCYPTIGEVTCYGEPDPFPGHQRELGSGSAVATAAR